MRGSKTRREVMVEGSTRVAAIAAIGSAGVAGASLEGESAMKAFLCVTCGTQFPESARPPEKCLICEDERQYVPPEGQQWTTLEAMRKTHRVVIKPEETG